MNSPRSLQSCKNPYRRHGDRVSIALLRVHPDMQMLQKTDYVCYDRAVARLHGQIR